MSTNCVYCAVAESLSILLEDVGASKDSDFHDCLFDIRNRRLHCSPNQARGSNPQIMNRQISESFLSLYVPHKGGPIMCPIKGRQSITMINGHFNPLYKKYRSRFLLYSAICLGFCDGLHDNNTGKLKFPK